MKFCVYSDNGAILQTGICSDDSTLENIPGNKIKDIANEVSSNTHYIDNGVPVRIPDRPSAVHIWNWDNKKWEQDTELAAKLARDRRDTQLAACDWTQLPDVPIATKQKWATYRQQLRDITNQSGFPFVIDWPVCP